MKLSRTMLAGMTIGLVCVPLLAMPAAAAPPTKPAAQPAAQPAGWRTGMLTLVNEERAAAGVAPVQACPRLNQVATAYARTMAKRDHYGHTGPDGESPWDRVRARGYEFTAAAENIAAGYGSVAEVQAGWVGSPGHFANMTSPNVTDAGFGFAKAAGSTYGTYWVQVFATGGSCNSL